VFAVVFFHRIYESVELGNASFDHQPPSKLVAPDNEPPVYAGRLTTVK